MPVRPELVEGQLLTPTPPGKDGASTSSAQTDRTDGLGLTLLRKAARPSHATALLSRSTNLSLAPDKSRLRPSIRSRPRKCPVIASPSSTSVSPRSASAPRRKGGRQKNSGQSPPAAAPPTAAPHRGHTHATAYLPPPPPHANPKPT